MTVNPLHQGGQPLIYMIAVLRHSDKTVVASYCSSKEVTKEGIRECIASNAGITPGKRYSTQGESQAIQYVLDAQGRVYALVTSPRYPVRVAFSGLEELQDKFGRDFGPKVASATEESLNKPARFLLKEIADKYTDPANVDKLSSVQDKINVVTTTMKENIQQILQNEEKLERIEAASAQLNEKSQEFKAGSKALNDKMWWKMWKMRLLIGGLIVAVLLIIIVPTAVSIQGSSNKR